MDHKIFDEISPEYLESLLHRAALDTEKIKAARQRVRDETLAYIVQNRPDLGITTHEQLNAFYEAGIRRLARS